MNKKQRAKNKKKTLTLTPMLPKKYNSRERAEIRAKEKAILGGK
jgi:hypothetical protein